MTSDGSIRIVLFPFPGQGHFSAFLSLAAFLHRAHPTADITLVSTPRNVEGLRCGSAGSPTAQYLRFHALPFVPAEHGLPGHGESADTVPVHRFIELFEATESGSLQEGFDGFVRDLTGDDGAGGAGARVCVIADPFLAWTSAVARRHGAAHAIFVSCGALGAVVYHSLWNHQPHRRAPGDDAFFLPDHPEVAVHRSQLPRHLLDADGTDRWSGFHRRQISAGYDTDAVLINTMEELETAGMRMLRRTMGVPVYPIGPLVRSNHADAGDGDAADVIRWLDAQEERSVLYISFGSINTLRLDQMVDLAAALELTGRPFVWAIRPPVGFDTNGGAFSVERPPMPEGFVERARAKNTGLLIHGWAPQVIILAHRATGAFLSHCGWNSALESLAHGLPILAWKLMADQFFNARMLEEQWGACVEVSRGNGPGSPAPGRQRLADAVEEVMGSSTAVGDTMRRRADEIREMIGRALEGGGSSVTALDEFLALTSRDRTMAQKFSHPKI
ncbi:UDP-glycosyltransferase 92A1-like [Oryza brachyantha]|uniref:UDP-glycosyltransferase 92A1-like n=1 Tax=Oryza brachyantha TaxID=4533 RepID=UPI001ADD2640|nr:UDP-glycosyltransferase 92A1-like [Oryza brachyantha]